MVERNFTGAEPDTSGSPVVPIVDPREAAVRRFFDAYSRHPDAAAAILRACGDMTGVQSEAGQLDPSDRSYYALLVGSTAALSAAGITLSQYPPAPRVKNDRDPSIGFGATPLPDAEVEDAFTPALDLIQGGAVEEPAAPLPSNVIPFPGAQAS